MEHLNLLNGEALKKIARALAPVKGLTRKEQLARLIEQELRRDPEAFLQRCSVSERLILAEAVHAGGFISVDEIVGKYGAPPPRDVPNHYQHTDISPYFALARRNEDDEIEVPDDVIDCLRAALPAPRKPAIRAARKAEMAHALDQQLPLQPGGHLARVYEGGPRMFQEARNVLFAVQAGRIGATEKGGTPTGSALKRLTDCLLSDDFQLDLSPEAEKRRRGMRIAPLDKAGPVRAFAWPMILRGLGWVRAKGTAFELTPAGREALAQGVTPATFAKALDRLWTWDEFDELRRIESIKGQTGKARRWLTRPSLRRQSILASVKEWPVATWISIEEAGRFLLASGNSFRVSENAWSLYIAEAQYGSLGYDGCDEGLRGQYLRVFLFEILGTLGILDVVYTPPYGCKAELGDTWGADGLDFVGRYDGLRYLRLTPWGAFALGLTETYDAPAAPTEKILRVLPNLDVALSGPPAEAERLSSLLSMFAVPVQDRVWRIDRAAMLDHVERGGNVAEIRKALGDHAAHDLPQTVQALLDEVERKVGALRPCGEALLVEAVDATVAASIANEPELRALCRAAGERGLVVLRRNERGFRSALKRCGYVLPP